MTTIKINDIEYEVVRNDNKCINEEELSVKITEYFENFDYIVRDYSYDKVRLKGFLEPTNPKKTEINDYSKLDKYIETYCSYGARIFILKKVKEKNLK